MAAVPIATPLTTPLDTPTVATPGAAELHVPPEAALPNVVELPTQIFAAPDIGGLAFTVSAAVTTQPEGVVYEMATVPAVTPAAIPDEAPMVATEGLALDHVPPVVLLLNVVLLPWQTIVVPVMGVGRPTFTPTVAVQPADEV